MRHIRTHAQRKQHHRIINQAARCAVEPLEQRRLMCGLPPELLIPAPEWSDAIEQQYANQSESPDAVSIVWANRGDASDNFSATFGTSANAARAVVDAALDHWERVITSWNRSDGTSTLQVNISIAGFGFGGGGAPAVTAPADGKPRSGSLTLGAGNPGQFPDPNDSNGWYFDPNPNDHAEFNGPLMNPYAGNAPGIIAPDFYSLAVAELTHVLGLVSDRNNDGTAWQGYRLESSGMATNTGIPDSADGNGTFWAFQGPTIDHLMTSFDAGAGDWGNIVHSASPNNAQGNPVIINFNGKTWQGSASAGNGRANAARTIPDFAMAHVLADAYGYSIVEPWQFDTFHYLLNRNTGLLLIRGGVVNTNSSDVITIGRSGSMISVTVDVGNDVPGTGHLSGPGNLSAFSALFNSSEVTSITIAGMDGDDTINIDGAFANIPIQIDGGLGNDTINLTPAGDNLDLISAPLVIQGGGGTNTLVLHDTANGFSDTFTVTASTIARTLVPTIDYSGFETVRIDAGAGSGTFNVNSLLNAVTFQINAGGGTDVINVGPAGGNADAVQGTLSVFGQNGTDTLNWNDSTSSFAGTYTMTSNSLSRTGGATVTHGTIETIVLNAAAGDNTINVNSTTGASTTFVNGGSGRDTINVAISAANSLTINGGNDNDIINLNNVASLSNSVVTNGNAGLDTLNYNDQNNSVSSTYTVTSSTAGRSGLLAVQYGTLEAVVINAGILHDTFEINSTAIDTTVTANGGNGDDRMHVTFPSGNLFNARGPVVFNGGAGNNTAVLYDDLSTANDTYAITNTQVTRSGGFGGFTYAQLSAVTLLGSGGNNTFNINSSAAGTALTVEGRAGIDLFNITQSSGDLSSAAGAITLDGGPGVDTVVLYDHLSTSSQTTTITTNQVTHPGFGPFTYSMMESLVFEGGSGNDVIIVESNAATTRVTARGGGGDDEFRIGAGSLATVPAQVQVEGGGGSNLAILSDALTFDNEGFTVTATQISHPGFGGLVYSELATLTVQAGFGANTFTVNSTSGVTDIRLNGNAGNDFYEVNSTNKPVIIDAGGGTGNVINSIPSGSARLVIVNNQTLQSLTLIGDARATLDGTGMSVLTQFLTVLSGAQLDVGRNAVVIDYSGSSPLASVRSAITSGYAGGLWSGVGITSSAAAMDSGLAVGYAEASDVLGPTGGTFFGRTVDATAVLIRQTRYGDANLDGTVNLTDFNRIAANFGASSANWSQGDFNFDGQINLADFNRLAGNFGLSASARPGATADQRQPARLEDLLDPFSADAASDFA